MNEQNITLEILFEMEKQDFNEINIKSYGDRHILDKLLKQHKNGKYNEEGRNNKEKGPKTSENDENPVKKTPKKDKRPEKKTPAKDKIPEREEQKKKRCLKTRKMC